MVLIRVRPTLLIILGVIVLMSVVSTMMAQTPLPPLPTHQHPDNITELDALKYVVLAIVAGGSSIIGAVIAFFHARWQIRDITGTLSEIGETLKHLVKQGTGHSGRIEAVEAGQASMEGQLRKFGKQLDQIQSGVEEIEAEHASAQSESFKVQILEALREELRVPRIANVRKG